MISFTIPGAVPKGRPRVFMHKQSGKIMGMTPKRTRDFESSGRIIAAAAARQQHWTCTSEPVEVEVRVYRQALRGDLDNYTKAALDSINGILFVDDRQIIHIDAAMFLDRERPRTEVTVRLAGREVG